MPRDGSGIYSLPFTLSADKANGVAFDAARFDALLSDIAAALNIAVDFTDIGNALMTSSSHAALVATLALVPNDITGLPAAAKTGAFSDVTGKPTTLAGYGITNALVTTNNLSDVPNPATARTNLGLSAVAASGSYGDLSGTPSMLTPANNLSDLANAGTARTNLGLGSAAVLDVGVAADKIVRFDSSGKYPAADGSQITGIATNVGPQQGRITLSTGVRIMTTTVGGATTIRYTPYNGLLVPLWDGTRTTMVSIGSELSQALSDATKSPASANTSTNYYMFVWLDGSTMRFTRGPGWISDTSPGTGAWTTELTWANNGWPTNKYDISNGPLAGRGLCVGAIRTNGSGSVDYNFGGLGAGGVAASFGVCNAFNQVLTTAFVADSTNSWTLGSTSIRPANNSTAMRVSYLFWDAANASKATYYGHGAVVSSGTGSCGIGYDSTTAMSGVIGMTDSTTSRQLVGQYSAQQIGWHYMQAIESSTAGAGGVTFMGDNNTPTTMQAGLLWEGWL